jgi:hypothetical protein
MDTTESPQSSPEKRRRKIPEKFRDHVVQDLRQDNNMTPESEMKLPANHGDLEAEALAASVSEDAEQNGEADSATEAKTDEVSVKRRRGRPPKIRMDMSNRQVKRRSEVRRISSAF